MTSLTKRTSDPRGRPGSAPAGFTLVELMVVITIIGILMAFVMVVMFDSIDAARRRETQSLILKLDEAITDRLDSLMTVQAPTTLSFPNYGIVIPNQAYLALASIVAQDSSGNSYNIPSPARAQVIAQADMVRAEMPDFFFVQVDPSSLSTSASASDPPTYPLNFLGVASQWNSTPSVDSYLLPLGIGDPTINPLPPVVTPQNMYAQSTGVYGASYGAAAGIYRQLGYAPQGYDGSDNNNNGYIDEWAEGIYNLDSASIQKIIERLTIHYNGQISNAAKVLSTVRAEMLYALLVEGTGPLGSSFNAEDFTARQVRDTDGDGLMEFVDGWDQPIRFYLWPLYHPSPIQKGTAPYRGMIEPREQDPLDPNQLLMGPAWWATLGSSPPTKSPNATSFETYFCSLTEPNPLDTTNGTNWDRSGLYGRRAYFWKPLIVSGGPDGLLGTYEVGQDYDGNGTADILSFPAVATTVAVSNVRLNEEMAPPVYWINPAASGDWLDAEGDDVSNHNLSYTGGGPR